MCFEFLRTPDTIVFLDTLETDVISPSLSSGLIVENTPLCLTLADLGGTILEFLLLLSPEPTIDFACEPISIKTLSGRLLND